MIDAPDITTDDLGRYQLVAPMHRFRCLFSDGLVIDVAAVRDDSILREALGRLHKRQTGEPRGIVGIADLGPEED